MSTFDNHTSVLSGNSTSKNVGPTLLWFRRDLRLLDNPALYQAMKAGPVIAVYTLNDQQWHEHGVSDGQKGIIAARVLTLKDQLNKLSVPLIALHTSGYKHVPSQLVKLAKQYDCASIMFNHEYEINERQLSDSVKRDAAHHSIAVQSFHDQCLIEPGQILNKQSQPYKVFTAFKKAYLAELNSKMRPIYGAPTKHVLQSNVQVQSDTQCVEQYLKNLSLDYELDLQLYVCEATAHEHLDEFCRHRIQNYQQDRDLPAIDGTSQLSTFLAIGVLSVRQCYQAVEVSGHKSRDGANTWVSELIWRDFYRHLMYLYPRLCMHQAFKQKTEALPWRHDEHVFLAWKQGQTGFPLVDAAMRQLNQTGWMHNRLRMVAAMFLTKHLFIDWRLGEGYFMSRLLDGDLASNNGGWQWSASTGVDAVPYFRIFNPTRQSERFDSTGLFIRQYVPELASLDNKSIHNPSNVQRKQLGYAQPMVDHASAVKQTKAWFKQLDDTAVNQMSLERV